MLSRLLAEGEELNSCCQQEGSVSCFPGPSCAGWWGIWLHGGYIWLELVSVPSPGSISVGENIFGSVKKKDITAFLYLFFFLNVKLQMVKKKKKKRKTSASLMWLPVDQHLLTCCPGTLYFWIATCLIPLLWEQPTFKQRMAGLLGIVKSTIISQEENLEKMLQVPSKEMGRPRTEPYVWRKVSEPRENQYLTKATFK